MKQNYLTLPEDSTEVLRGCFWAVANAAPFILFILLTWLGILRGQLAQERNRRIADEQELDVTQRERDSTVALLTQRLANVDAARRDAEAKASTASDAKARAEAQFAQEEQELSSIRAARSVPANDSPAQASQQSPVAAPALDTQTPPAPVTAPPAATTVPSAAEIADFVRMHLGRMMGPVAGQLADYFDVTDFHDKPNASLEAIGMDRSRWEEKWPRRLIFKDDVRPEVVFENDPNFNWVATATFNWRWVFWSRAGTMIQGVYRDTWKIVPGVGGSKIISEHSVDAATGRSRD
jgi:hypothetical protein